MTFISFCRNLKDKAQKIDNLTVKSGMQYKICRNTYHMFYIIGTEDTFIRHANIPSPSPSTFGFNGWVDAKLSNRSESEAECYRLLNQ
jgi:paired amphipathic helix protein Sin3a